MARIRIANEKEKCWEKEENITKYVARKKLH